MSDASSLSNLLTHLTTPVRSPLSAIPAIPAGLSAEPLQDGGRSGRLLLVDSLEINRRLAKGMLRSAGQYEFFEAASGRAALDILDRQPVDLVILDLMMPDISGPEFCRRLKS